MREKFLPSKMKLIFLGSVFAASVLAGCSSQGLQSQSPSTVPAPLVSSTPAPTPSHTPLTDAEKQNRDEFAKELRRINLEYKEAQEKNREEHQKNKLCFMEEYNANFSPNDDVELSPECKKRLADLNKQKP